MEKYILLLSSETWENPCSDAGILKAFQIGGYFLFFAKIVVPIVLIIMASIDLGKAVVSSDDKAIKTATSSLIKKAIAGVIIFFIPTIVNYVVAMTDKVSDTDYYSCTKCLNKPSECKSSGGSATEDLFTFE